MLLLIILDDHYSNISVRSENGWTKTKFKIRIWVRNFEDAQLLDVLYVVSFSKECWIYEQLNFKAKISNDLKLLNSKEFPTWIWCISSDFLAHINFTTRMNACMLASLAHVCMWVHEKRISKPRRFRVKHARIDITRTVYVRCFRMFEITSINHLYSQWFYNKFPKKMAYFRNCDTHLLQFIRFSYTNPAYLGQTHT